MSIQVTSINGQPYINGKPVYYGEVFPHRNLLINGGFDVWQRGNSFTGGGYYTDRWLCGITSVVSRGETIALSGCKYTMDFDGSSSNPYIMQKIENSVQMGGKTFTLSFWYQKVPREVKVTDGAGNETSHTAIATGNIDNSYTEYAVTFSLPYVNNAVDGSVSIKIQLSANVGSVHKIGKAQLEEGSIATPFEQVPIADTLARCQRYYESRGYGRTQTYSETGSHALFEVAYTVPKRISPNVTVVASIRLNSDDGVTMYKSDGTTASFTARIIPVTNGMAGSVYSFKADAEL